MVRISKVLTVGVVGLLAVVGSAVAQDKVLMRVNLEVGQVYSYKMAVKTEVSEVPESNSDSTALYSMVVVGKSDKGYEILSVLSDQKVKVPSAEEFQIDPIKISMQLDYRGKVLEMKVTEPEGTELPPQMLESTVLPNDAIGMGSTWTQSYAGNEDYGINPGSYRYTVKERKKWKDWDVFVVQVGMTKKQTIFDVSGEIMLDVKSGMIVYSKMKSALDVIEVGRATTTSTMELVSAM